MKFSLILLLFVCCSCNSKYEHFNKKETLLKLDKLANLEYGDVYKIDNNDNETYVVVSKINKELGDLFPDISYFIYDYKKQLIVKKDYLKAGSIKWVSTNRIQAISRNLDKDESKSRANKIKYYFDVKLKKTVYIKE